MSEWVSLTHEEPVDPKRRIVDTHHHLWADGQRNNPHSYSGGGEPAYLPQHLHADMNGHNFIGSVFVECGIGYRTDGPEHLRSSGETEFIANQARLAAGKGPPLLGIVANADIARVDVLDEVLDAHVEAGEGLFCGIRQMPVAFGRPPRDLLSEPAFRDGLKILGRRGFTFDAMLSYTQLLDLARFAPTVPGTTLIVDHLGAPMVRPDGPSRAEVTAVWRDGIRALATCTNVVLKLGGIGMERVFGMTWSRQEKPPTSDTVVERWRDEVRFCIDTLGPDRCMFESNFPVDRLAIGYTVLWNAFQKMAAAYTDDEQDSLFSGTACRVYRLAHNPEQSRSPQSLQLEQTFEVSAAISSNRLGADLARRAWSRIQQTPWRATRRRRECPVPDRGPSSAHGATPRALESRFQQLDPPPFQSPYKGFSLFGQRTGRPSANVAACSDPGGKSHAGDASIQLDRAETQRAERAAEAGRSLRLSARGALR